MDVFSIRHRGLRRLIEDDNPQFLRPDLVDRVRKVVAALVLAEGMDEFRAVASPGWRVHQLVGERRGEWSVSISGNWRITFVEEKDRITQLNLEDYH